MKGMGMKGGGAGRGLARGWGAWLVAWVFAAACMAQTFEPPERTPDGFLVPRPGRRFEFPQDHGRHDGFKIEWWYVTGQVAAEDGRELGYQLTFFRNGGPAAPPAHQGAGAAAGAGGGGLFAHAPLHLAHCAVLDVKAGRFLHESRINREGWDAGAALGTLKVWNGPWRLERTTPATGGPETLQLRGGVRGEASMELRLVAEKPLVVFGTNGVSRKGRDPTASSHYLTFTRLRTEGVVRIGGARMAVKGLSWMDHEFSSSQLEPGQSGWDWACVLLDDGTELMAYRMRRDDGTTDPFSTLAWVGADGVPRHSGPDRFRWEVEGHWTSGLTGARYPNRVRITGPRRDGTGTMELRLEPLMDAQEVADPLGGVAYWEGACRVRDGTGKIVGRAYLELAGDVGRVREKFR